MIKAPETCSFQMLGNFEILGTKPSHGTSKKLADVRRQLRKVSKKTFIQFIIETLFILLTLFVSRCFF